MHHQYEESFKDEVGLIIRGSLNLDFYQLILFEFLYHCHDKSKRENFSLKIIFGKKCNRTQSHHSAALCLPIFLCIHRSMYTIHALNVFCEFYARLEGLVFSLSRFHIEPCFIVLKEISNFRQSLL